MDRKEERRKGKWRVVLVPTILFLFQRCVSAAGLRYGMGRKEERREDVLYYFAKSFPEITNFFCKPSFALLGIVSFLKQDFFRNSAEKRQVEQKKNPTAFDFAQKPEKNCKSCSTFKGGSVHSIPPPLKFGNSV